VLHIYIYIYIYIYDFSSLRVNGTRFDFAEGESQLVSGFNVEYVGGGFALIILSEYASILFITLLFCIIFISSDLYPFFFMLSLLLFRFYLFWFVVLCLFPLG
jgi:NADH-ubiquinone oxidoreductase chain 1